MERFRLPVRTACDGEVIPQLWAKIGVEALAELRGMFAVALADTLEDRLYLARDPFGIKPLYWRLLPALSAACGSTTQRSLGTCATGRWPRTRARSLRSPPSRPTASRSWDRTAVSRSDHPAEARPRSSSGLPTWARRYRESVRLHLGADVPTALLLSGGVDSAAVAAIGRHLGQDLHCLTVAADGAPDETLAAAQTARHYGHHFQRVQVDLDSDMVRFFQAMQRPSVDGLNTYLICQAVHQAGFKVALSGLGGDEAVGGTPTSGC